jgi:uncharacterized metal-binding protein YceD (DUF177 family)
VSEHLPVSYPLRVADLATRKPTRFDLSPNEADCALIAALIGISAVRKLRFKGELRPAGKHDFTLEAQLGATVVQPCVVSLAPVTTRIDEPVIRRYINGLEQPDADETEIPEDDSIEPLPDVIDVGAVLLEALALALPPYPRAKGADLGEAVFAAPGTAPLRNEDLRPFAGLAGLRDKLTDTSGTDGSGGENDAG